MYIEIKHAGPSDWALERAVAADLEGYEGPVAAMSFEPTSLRALSIVKPELTRGIVAEARGGDTGLGIWKRFSRRHLLHLPATQPHFIAYNVDDMPAPVPVLANTLTGMPLLVWTVRTPQERERADLVGAQMIFEGFTP